jgi:7-carboxy-7-deazaguanine synthase
VDSLLVSEIFSSVQGEGINTGRPATFLRLAVCNLHCWYCDTKYTWLFNEQMLAQVQNEMKRLGINDTRPDLRVYDKNEEAKGLSISDILKQILAFDCPHLVITGGEPLLQQDSLCALLERLLEERKFFVELETNGTIKPGKEILDIVSQWNVSPKLAFAGNGSYASEKPECFETFKKLNAYFKFVIQSEKDLEDCEEIVQKYSIPKNKVVLMPEAINSRLLEERGRMLFSYCKDKGYKFSTRLQILLYGNARGK